MSTLVMKDYMSVMPKYDWPYKPTEKCSSEGGSGSEIELSCNWPPDPNYIQGQRGFSVSVVPRKKGRDRNMSLLMDPSRSKTLLWKTLGAIPAVL